MLATKELILVSAAAAPARGVLAIASRSAELSPDVIDQNLLATTVLEIGPGHHSSQYTGRAVVFPNRLVLLGHPVINETYMKEYIVHVMTIPLMAEDQWQVAEKLLPGTPHHECLSFMQEARGIIRQVEGKALARCPVRRTARVHPFTLAGPGRSLFAYSFARAPRITGGASDFTAVPIHI